MRYVQEIIKDLIRLTKMSWRRATVSRSLSGGFESDYFKLQCSLVKTKTLKVGEYDYDYPVIEVSEFYLWPPKPVLTEYNPHDYDPYYRPYYYPFYPWSHFPYRYYRHEHP